MMNVQEDSGTNAISLLVENLPAFCAQARNRFESMPNASTLRSTILISFWDPERIHQALSLPGPGRPCQPGAIAVKSFGALRAWIEGQVWYKGPNTCIIIFWRAECSCVWKFDTAKI